MLITQWKSKIGVRRIKTIPFLPTPLTTPLLTFRLWSSENQIVGVVSRGGRINESQCTFLRIIIGLVLSLLLPTPIIWFSLDHKRNVSYGVVSRIEERCVHLNTSSTLLIKTPSPSFKWKPAFIKFWINHGKK